MGHAPNEHATSRERLAHFLHQPKFHHAVIGLVLFDLLLIMIETALKLNSVCIKPDGFTELLTPAELADIKISGGHCGIHPSHGLHMAEHAIFWLSVAILVFFCCEILAAFYAFGWRHFTKPVYFIDTIVIFTSLALELYFHFSGKEEDNPSATVALLWKIIRALHAIAHSVELKNHELVGKMQETYDALADANVRERFRVSYLRRILRDQYGHEVDLNAINAGSMDDIHDLDEERQALRSMEEV
ncbi:hypothetical protein BDK51DRAFT_44878 [Blyttiomyces helicus]|uniref:Voltage-gated hydrogen channel 1 n=1 Tax=Blyttiomyces helicus TaxID=388810 RepID=A0A4P9W6L1_9FUNG|nr:hypothetical protein BDK51DRAFT_44878 [Blyttiomyces helicus]|eukprot:RKO88099.1 hypothetical protein BDK51DRAFT_44878 [Blyttiomyces helicus]